MKWFFDIDGTLTDTYEREYEKAEPDEAMIALVNMLYDKGDYIVLITARGTSSGTNWEKITKNQLKKWGLKYHELHFGRFVTDFAWTPERFLNEM